MLGIVATMALGQEHIRFGKLHSRLEFNNAIPKIDRGWTKKQVENLLGKPDDIVAIEDKNGDATWCYGTNGHGTFPTLGIVPIKGGRVTFPLSYLTRTQTLDTKSFSEAELRQKIREVHRLSSRNQSQIFDFTNECDPLGIIRVANSLIPLGRQKAIDVLSEYYWAFPYSAHNHEWLYWLARTIFVPKNSKYVFPIPTIGAYLTEFPKDFQKWPTYPVFVTKDIPVTIFTGSEGSGGMPMFGIYLKNESVNWKIRNRKLSPPADPFLAYPQILNSGLMGFKHREDREIIRNEILLLVRTAYKPSLTRHYGDSADENFEGFHQEFLNLGCRWDAKQDLYVRTDGSYDKKELP